MIRIVAVGKIKDRQLKALIDDYQTRIGHFHNIEISEVAQVTTKDPAYNLNREGEELLKLLPQTDFVVLLALEGVSLDSLTLASRLEVWNMKHPNLTFVIGGSDGVSAEVKQRADFLWQLAELTFPHQLARLLLLEQLYRSYKIINKQTYHK